MNRQEQEALIRQIFDEYRRANVRLIPDVPTPEEINYCINFINNLPVGYTPDQIYRRLRDYIRQNYERIVFDRNAQLFWQNYQPQPPLDRALGLGQEQNSFGSVGSTQSNPNPNPNLPRSPNPSFGSDVNSTNQRGGVKKEYVTYKSHRYVVRKEKNKKYIVTKGKTIYLADIRGQYKKCD